MAGNGGKRDGAGRPLGSSVKYPGKELIERFGGDILLIVEAWLKDPDKSVQRAAVKELLPYVAQKMPALMQIESNVRISLTAEQVRKLPQDKLDRILAGESVEAVLADARN